MIMFGEISESPGDVRFHVAGIPCRIHPFFWLGALVFALPRGDVPGNVAIALVLSRTACLLISILVHELGHALVVHWAGFRPHIVLHGFGGYCAYNPHRPISMLTSVAISFAGPAAGFLLFIVAYFGGNALLLSIDEVPLVLVDAVVQLQFINLVWGLVNLLPIIPLDGGQIVRAILQGWWSWSGLRIALMISILVSAAGAVVSYQIEGRQLFAFPVLLFGLLCFQNVQMYQEVTRRN